MEVKGRTHSSARVACQAEAQGRMHCAAAVAPMAAEGRERPNIANRGQLGQSKAALRVMLALAPALSE